MRRKSKSLAKRKPRQYGSIKECPISEVEMIEYRQTGMIKVKETPLSAGELSRMNYRYTNYYDWVENNSRIEESHRGDDLWDFIKL